MRQPEEITLFQNGIDGEEDRSICGIGEAFFPEEKKMPLFKYIRRYPMYGPAPEVLDFLERQGRIAPEDTLAPGSFTKLLEPEGYQNREYGYTLFEDGSGYLAFYRIRPRHVTHEMEKWYHNWSCAFPAHTVEGHGNLRFKLWHPEDHLDKYYVNWKDFSFGMYQKDSLKLNGTVRTVEYIRHEFDLAPYGLTTEKHQSLREHGVFTNRQGYFNAYVNGGSSVSISAARTLPDGREEIRTRVWMGYRPLNGVIIRDPAVKCSEELLKALLLHRTMEWEHLYSFLPALYEEYKNLPEDAD